jgi:ribose transport system permease protein
MCATIAAIVYNSTGNVALACILSIALGAVLGIVNAVLANVLDLPVMVMTLTMLNILNSVHAVILKTQGNELGVNPGMPGNTVVYATFLICFFLLLWAIFNYTKMGRRNKFIGSNSMAAKYSGVSLMKTGIISFAISGVGLGIAGFLFASYKSGSSFSTGTILDTIGLNVVIAIVFGGMTTSGGPRSKVSCAVIGAFFCIFLDELFRSVGAADYRFLAKGIIFLIVSFANMYSTRPKMLAR